MDPFSTYTFRKGSSARDTFALAMDSMREFLFFATVFGFLGLHVVHAMVLWTGPDIVMMASTAVIVFCIFYSTSMYLSQAARLSRKHMHECPSGYQTCAKTIRVCGQDINKDDCKGNFIKDDADGEEYTDEGEKAVPSDEDEEELEVNVDEDEEELEVNVGEDEEEVEDEEDEEEGEDEEEVNADEVNADEDEEEVNAGVEEVNAGVEEVNAGVEDEEEVNAGVEEVNAYEVNVDEDEEEVNADVTCEEITAEDTAPYKENATVDATT